MQKGGKPNGPGRFSQNKFCCREQQGFRGHVLYLINPYQFEIDHLPGRTHDIHNMKTN